MVIGLASESVIGLLPESVIGLGPEWVISLGRNPQEELLALKPYTLDWARDELHFKDANVERKLIDALRAAGVPER